MQFVPGPFYMGDGFLGWFVNVTCILWTCFVCIIFALPTVLPVTAESMNYAAVRLPLRFPHECSLIDEYWV